MGRRILFEYSFVYKQNKSAKLADLFSFHNLYILSQLFRFSLISLHPFILSDLYNTLDDTAQFKLYSNCLLQVMRGLK